MIPQALAKKLFKYFLGIPMALALVVPGSLWAALQIWGEDVFLYQLEPALEFGEGISQPAPDYRERRAWAARPGQVSAAMLVPRGENPVEAVAPADVFYIHPTSFLSGASWNAPLFVKSRAWEMIDVMLAAQASAFNACCEIYAPHYRQATLWSFLDREGRGGDRALDLAYSDISRAFDAFLEQNQGRPFLIASHSQGTYHALRLLADKVDGTELQQRLIAAYLVGYWLPLDVFGRTLRSIPPCESASDTGCVVHWSTYGEQGKRRQGVPHWYPEGNELADGKALLCTNPLNWQRGGGRVEADQHPGALYVSQGGTVLNTLFNYPADVQVDALENIRPGWTWAECQEGLLRIAAQTEGVFAENGAPQNQDYHILDYNLFYQAVRENARQRVFSHGSRQLVSANETPFPAQ